MPERDSKVCVHAPDFPQPSRSARDEWSVIPNRENADILMPAAGLRVPER